MLEIKVLVLKPFLLKFAFPRFPLIRNRILALIKPDYRIKVLYDENKRSNDFVFVHINFLRVVATI